MMRPLPLILILAVMLTSIGLGAARGTVRMGDQIVLCTGHGVVVIQRPGESVPSTHLCPDMALSLMAAVAPADVVLDDRRLSSRHLAPGPVPAAAPVARAQARVRDPPAALRG
ncbi:DUF2946 domain-containing protein [Paracoccus nototheniae]|uniref:hypothetical protein n=1 Tax=Paracoccus nototheniae TaxID=2489002 RepID=UPI0013F3FE41|nr:hypothetical protein [Paracoccus nototheniae]